MCKLGFSDQWIKRKLQCLSSVSFSFKVNNEICVSVIPSRGLRQGDPISPYLFLLCVDAFSGLLSKATHYKLIQGAKICKSAPRISHLFFADDNILFAKATPNECSKIAEIISVYERASGQKVNLDKTEIAFSKCVSPERRFTIIGTLGVREVDKHEKYLGLPTVIDSGGVRRLIKGRLHWQSWDALCRPKALGGMGFRDLKCFNLSLLAKQIWRLQSNPNTLLFKVLKARYFKYSSILKANRGHDPNYIWRSIWGAKGLFRDGLAWKIGNGRDANIWSGTWLVNNRLPVHLQRPPEFDEEMKVYELLTEDGRMWDAMKVRQVLGEDLCGLVLSLPLLIHETNDTTF
ncbi:uncharacterized protein LOC110703173 [Chenopodium quinoa]|uniref:uncharacterized protein LOC110703173 n=1 Tax=Chenopodium quinoa TaxID=63459 RepID=UPI000B789F91|nr:uncharacterized protein LOC110703173 [Chenopodium quinoa]